VAKLFKQALYEDRPAFVDYFLRINYDPRRTLDLIELRRHTESYENDSPTSVEPDNTLNIQKLTAKDVIVEFQNQNRLSKRGLEFIFELYKKGFNSNTRVSRCFSHCVSFSKILSYYRCYFSLFY
jgi:hypothetical protein